MNTRAPDTRPGRYDWHDAALCKSSPELFFPDHGGSCDEARRICAVCPIQAPCLQQAMDREAGQPFSFRFGVWGGLTPRERAALDGETVPAKEPLPKPKRCGGNRPIAPCGTYSAYQRHRRNEEPIDLACFEAYEEYNASRRKGTRGAVAA